MGLNCLCPFDHYKTTAENPSFIFRPWQENITLHHPPTKLISPKTTISSKLGTSSYSKQQKNQITSTKTNKQSQALNNTYQHKIKLISNILSLLI